MADKKISALTGATTPLAGTEVLPIVQGGSTVKVSIANLTAGRAVTASSFTVGTTAVYDISFPISGVVGFPKQVAGPSYPFAFDHEAAAYGQMRLMSSNTSTNTLNKTIMAFNQGGDVAVSAGNLVVGTAGKGITTGSATALGFGINNSTTDLVIDTNKNVRVGSTSGFDAGVIAYPNSGSSYLGLQHTTGTASGVSYVQFVYDSNQIATISQNGTTGVLYNTSSDARLKENIADANDAAGLIDAIKVRKFDWKSDGSHQRYGFIAQELVKIAPEAVHQPADPDEMMGVDYSKLVPMLVKEIQSLRARVAQLEGK